MRDQQKEKGYKVIIAGAGMAAHLPGMCAAIFPTSGNRRTDVRQEPGRTGCTLFYRADAAWNPGCDSSDRRRYERSNSGSQRCWLYLIRSSLNRLKAYTAEMKATVQGKDAKLQKLGHKEYMEQK